MDAGAADLAAGPGSLSPTDPERPDLRLAPAAAAAWGSALVAPAIPAPVALVGALGAAVAAGLLFLRSRRRTRERSALVLVAAGTLVCAAAGAASAALRVAALAAGPLPALAESRVAVEVEVVVRADPRPSVAKVHGSRLGQPLLVVDARVEQVRARGVVTRVRAPIVVLATGSGWADLLPGQRVRVAGRLVPAGEPDTAALLRARGPPERLGAPGVVQQAAGTLRAGLRRAVQPLPPAERGLVPGLVVGDTTALPPGLEDDFRTAGLTHLVAVSGANVAIVVGAVLYAGRRLGVRSRASPWLGALALAAFVVLARPQPSVLRAAVMGAVALLALVTGRARSALPALGAAVLTLVLADPWLARSYGFALSTLATAGILLLAPAWTATLARRLPRPLATALAVPAAAQVACGPVIAMLAGQVSLVSVPANLLVAPAVAPATLLGVAAAVTAPVAPSAAMLLGRLAGVPAGWIVAVAERSATVPHAALPWPSGRGGALALLAVTLAVAVTARPVLRQRTLTAALVTGLLAFGLPAIVRSGWPPRGWVLVACDVGQGDALALAAGRGSAVVIDAGPDPRAVDRCLRDLGVHRVPLVLLTHLHADHVEGLPGVLRRRAVGEVELGPLADPPEEAARVAGWLRGAGIASTTAAVGERREVDDLRWQVLWPQRIIRAPGSVPNNASLVILVETAGLRLLLTGDVEPPAQAALLRTIDGPVDVLKVAHHGSADQSAQLMARLAPRLAIVSVGADNDYGHPAPATLALLRGGGALVRRTDEDGDVAVLGPGDRLRVVSRRG